MRALSLLAAFCASSLLAAEPDFTPAVKAINQFGLELHQRLAAATPKANLCLSPYSIQSALSMAYAGAEGATRAEMAKVLHYPEGDAIHASIVSLETGLANDVVRMQMALRDSAGSKAELPIFTNATRLFGQQALPFEGPFLRLLRDTYRAPLLTVDFAKDPAAAAVGVNTTIKQLTRGRIPNLLPPNALGMDTRLLLVNAAYFKAGWMKTFPERATQLAPFYPGDGTVKKVAMMRRELQTGFVKRDGYRVVSLAYTSFSGLSFLVLLPDEATGLAALEKKLTAEELTGLAKLAQQDVILYLPRFRVQPPALRLTEELQAMGLKTAFDVPPGSADFSRMMAKTPTQYLALKGVFHQAYVAVNERGTEAAAATVLVSNTFGGPPEPVKPVEVKVDHPFLFAIQHESGACLFLGRVTEP